MAITPMLTAYEKKAKQLQKSMEREKKSEKELQEERKELKLRLTPEMLMVKDFYHAMRMEGQDVEPEAAATQCGITAGSVHVWFEDQEVREWFMTPPIKFKAALKAVTAMAIRKGRELLLEGGEDVQEKMTKYFIDQHIGKASDKKGDVDNEDDEDITELAKDIEELTKQLRGDKDGD